MTRITPCVIAALALGLSACTNPYDPVQRGLGGGIPIPGQYVPGYGSPTGTPGPNQPVTSGSFPRSFLVPGTDTSLRIGGFVNVTPLWYINGAAQSSQLNGRGGINNQTFYWERLPALPLEERRLAG